MKDRIQKIFHKEEDIDKKIEEIESILADRKDDEKIKMAAIRAIIGELKNELVESHYKSLTDDLTGFLNKKAIQDIFQKKLVEIAGKKINLSLIIIDIDGLKRINDTFGHLSGTKLIKNISVAISKSIRRSDIASRYGGDEFVVLCFHSKPEGINLVVDRIRDNVAKIKLDFDSKASVSLGFATYSKNNKTYKKLFEEADKMVYVEKAEKKKTISS